ncbi:MAG: hypothetical protein KJ058_05705 [Thermoanaerobaculia bacterium]|nr:hypothetical protein [Thermoanaerobaculia bacterium]
MPQREPQTYANHGRIVPLFHGGVFGVLVIQLVWSAYRLVRAPGGETVLGLLLALALLGLFYYARRFALTVQDRVIRLEMRLRCERLLPPELAERAAALPVAQLVALRFAGDGELEALVRDVVEGRLVAPDLIKRQIRDWQGDHLRV